MIYTLTLNPSLDHHLKVASLKLGETNRAEEAISPGGKGINVSKVLKNLGEDSTCLGFLAGFTGEELERRLIAQGLSCDFVKIRGGLTRINTKIKGEVETEINGLGPEIKESDRDRLLEKIDGLSDGDTLFLSGSIPSSLGQDFYATLMKNLSGREVRILVDATGEALKACLKYEPFLVKPNLRELEELFSCQIRSREEIAQYAENLKELGAKNVIISLGGEGAYLTSEAGDKIFRPAFKGKVVNTVGAGDSMVAGFFYGVNQGYSYERAFDLALACGTGTSFSEGLADRKTIENLLKGEENAN